jgi:hypothetical protein
MKHTLVRYRVKPEAVEANRRLIEAVFKALQARAPEDVSYLAVELGDGSFVHLKTDLADRAFELTELPEFQAFRRGIDERTEEEPRAAEARLVGSYRMAFNGGEGEG